MTCNTRAGGGVEECLQMEEGQEHSCVCWLCVSGDEAVGQTDSLADQSRVKQSVALPFLLLCAAYRALPSRQQVRGVG